MVPYTYLIGWSQYNRYYYGVRYAKNCRPEELWVKYKTSSAYVRHMCISYGEPDVIQVRKTFATAHAAMKWEHKVLRRLKVVKKDTWINKTDNTAIDFHTSKRITEPGRVAALAATKGKSYIEIHGPEKAADLIQQRKSASKKRWEDDDLRLRMSTKPDDTSNYKKAADRRWQDPQRKQAAALRMKQIWEKRKNQH